MTQAQRRYLALEAAIGAAINAVLSIAFVVLIFGRSPAITSADLVRDAFPQSFMVALMSALVPAVITRRRMVRGAVAPLPPSMLSRIGSLPLRAAGTALLVAAVFGAAHAVLLPQLLPGDVPFGNALVGKAIYGAALGALVTLASVRAAMGERGVIGA